MVVLSLEITIFKIHVTVFKCDKIVKPSNLNNLHSFETVGHSSMIYQVVENFNNAICFLMVVRLPA